MVPIGKIQWHGWIIDVFPVIQLALSDILFNVHGRRIKNNFKVCV